MGIYLAQALAPLDPYLARGDITDLYINRPGELWTETLGGKVERHDMPSLTAALLARMSEQVAALTGQGISRAQPLLSAMLPDGARAQFVAPSATRGDMAIAIRKHQAREVGIDDYQSQSWFLPSRAGLSSGPGYAAGGNQAQQLKDAVSRRLNVLISGGTSTGKTTFLNALLREVDADERLILIEDTPEIALTHANAVGLLASRGGMGEARIDMNDLLTAALRMRPDRIILGELRGPEAFTFLRAVNTGHQGSMTTIHADSPARAVEQLALLVLESGSRLSRADVADYVRASIDVYVHLARHGGNRYVSELSFNRDAGAATRGSPDRPFSA
ncbi:P-type DNA transfer ATPase VirB11 [Sandaracinobacteroides saxicola]|uniref:Type IV secretion system protein n=1 Tax=Sandaracinobacteroides saxicola TaxID=2759707 RepID=A0A7G5IGG6_9SPHN|nr:P-type DNA transfer ATPase VirB11 [Sandaracinobacteroides saxicola]